MSIYSGQGQRIQPMLKKTKLRHSEYYDMQKTYDELFSRSLNGNNFYKLMDIIGSEENIKIGVSQHQNQ